MKNKRPSYSSTKQLCSWSQVNQRNISRRYLRL